MRRKSWMCGLMFAVAVCHSSAHSLRAEERVVTWEFEDAAPDRLPEGWTSTKTGEGSGSVWKVVLDDSSPDGRKVLAQTSSDGPNRLFNLCVADQSRYRDVDLSVSFKAVSGTLDQGGGPVWRYRDKDNYYIARHNPLEANYRVYKVVDGKRTLLDSADVTVADGEWHTLRIVQRGKTIHCFLNGTLYLDTEDSTLPDAGQIGLWTKADAVTRFDKLVATRLDGGK